MTEHDPVNHPSHYTSHPSGVECIEITRHMPFNPGNAMKYLWRAGQKENAPTKQDYEKAIWYIQDEIKRLFPEPKYIEFKVHQTREERPRVQVLESNPIASECVWCHQQIPVGVRVKSIGPSPYHPFCIERKFEKDGIEPGIELGYK